MFQNHPLEASKSVLSGIPSEREQAAVNRSQNDLHGNGFEHNDNQTLFKKPQPVAKSCLANFLLGSKQSTVYENGESFPATMHNHGNTMPMQQSLFKTTKSVVCDLANDNKLAEVRVLSFALNLLSTLSF